LRGRFAKRPYETMMHMTTTIRRWGLLVGLLVLAAPAVHAQPMRLYTTLSNSKGYVVGSRLSQSGLFRHESDTSWAFNGWSLVRVSGVAADPATPRRRYLATGNGVLVTQDLGRSWRLATDWHVTETQDVAAEPGRAYAGTAYGIWRSEDGGLTWIESSTGIPEMQRYTQDLEVDASRPGRILAGTDGGVYVSEDGARSWRLAGPVVPVYDLAQSASNPRRWFAATSGHGLYRSDDGGRTWAQVATRHRTTSFLGVAVDPRNDRRVAAASWGHGLLVSTDGGRTWTSRTRGLRTSNVFNVLFDVNVPGRLWVGTVEGGIYTTDDLGRTFRYAGMNGTLVFDLAFLPEPQ
jgi:photosystem II stability/assembly factor-like uncharacterized protein